MESTTASAPSTAHEGAHALVPVRGPRRAVPVPVYYEEATPDYAAWSRGMHMHFGYWRPGLPVLDREPMLEAMSYEVFDRLALPARASEGRPAILDLGCGVGASSLLLTRRAPHARPLGVSLVPSQVAEARRQAAAVGAPARFLCADYQDTGLPGASFDGAFAIESACHARGEDKAALLEEAARLLGRGARLVVADGFLRRSRHRLSRPMRWLLDTVMMNWAVPSLAELDPFLGALEQAGFRDVEVTDVSWRVAPSALHAPFLTAAYWWAQRRAGRRLSPARRGHLIGSLLAPVLGACRSVMGYFIVRATRA